MEDTSILYFFVIISVYVLIRIGIGRFGKSISTSKGRSPQEGFLLGLLLGFFGIGIEKILPKKNPLTAYNLSNKEGTKKCPYCAETI